MHYKALPNYYIVSTKSLYLRKRFIIEIIYVSAKESCRKVLTLFLSLTPILCKQKEWIYKQSKIYVTIYISIKGIAN